MKKIMSIIVLFIGCSINSNQKETLDASKVLFAWDFHDVIVKKQPWSMITAISTLIWNADNKWELLKVSFNPRFWSDIINRNSDVLDDTIDDIIECYPALAAHKDAIINLGNLHEPIPETIALIKALKDQGYKHCLASNIAKDSYAVMLKKFPELFALFDGIYIAYTTNQEGVPYAKKAKPDVVYYEGLRAYLHDLGFPNDVGIVFIDDKEVNVKAAEIANVGIQAIQFRSTEQLQKDFEKKGICITSTTLSAQIV